VKTSKSSFARLSLVLILVLALVVSGCGKKEEATTPVTETGGTTSTTETETTKTETEVEVVEEIVKPEKITIMVDGTLVTKANGQDEFIAKWEELTGIELEIIQPDHSAYSDVLGQTFASGNWPDVVLLNSAYYAGYASEGILWDMTQAWENSELKASGRVIDEALVNGLKLDGKLYGISPARGNGSVTYIKKKWLDNVGMQMPTNYAEFNALMEAFTTGDPDGNGVNGDTYAVSSAGLIGEEIPYINYSPEFYQDAFPSFYLNDQGVWVDGFTEPAMVGALERLRDAYQAGYIDKESLTNKTSDVRNKFYEDKFGIFTYWAGTWATNLKTNLESNGLDGELVPMPPIAEVGLYLERQAPAWAITSTAENPEGIFKYFFETMLDGGEVQKLFTYGVEGVHWSTAEEEVVGKFYEAGQFHMLESLEKAGTQYTKNHIDPLLSIAKFGEIEDPGLAQVATEARISSDVFAKTSRLVELVPSNDAMSQYNGDLITLKREIVANVVTQGMSIEEEMKRFETDGGLEWSQMIIEALNSK
jgi:putative aldouronate transport system substrate-binding protein